MPINYPNNNPINNLTNSTTCQKKGDVENKPHSDKKKQMRKVSSPQSILTAHPSIRKQCTTNQPLIQQTVDSPNNYKS